MWSENRARTIEQKVEWRVQSKNEMFELVLLENEF